MKTSTLFRAYIIADAKRDWWQRLYPSMKQGSKYANLAYKLKCRIVARLEARDD